MKLPFAVIDIEASALSLSTWPELSSYPVEVGVAVVHARDAVSSWSSLIKPDPAWAKYGDWDAGSACIHKLTRDMLREGQSAATAAAALNTLLAPLGYAYCDGGDLLPGNHAIGKLARQMETSDAARPFYRGPDHRRAA